MDQTSTRLLSKFSNSNCLTVNYYIPGSGANFQAAYPVQTFSIPSYYKEYQGLLNTDYVINSKNTFSERFFMGTDPVTAPFAAGGRPAGIRLYKPIHEH